MRAVDLKSHGQADSLLLGERPLLQPGPGQVRVAIAYAGFNHVDLYMRDSGAGITHELPLILGVDGAGTVDAVGDGVSQWQQGDKVVIYPAQSCGHCEFCRRGEQMLCLTCKIVGEHIDGCFAEYVCVDAAMLFPVADHVSLQTAAVLPTAYLTAWRMVMTQARVAVGETVLVHGIGGGVALASLQLGAEAMVNYRNDKVVEAVMDFTDGRGVDVVIDNVGDATWGSSLRSLRRGGKIVTCGATTGAHPSADLQRVFVRQLQIIGSTLGNQDEFRALLAAVAEGQIEPVIDRVFDFDMAEEALKFLGEARQCGKLLLKIN